MPRFLIHHVIIIIIIIMCMRGWYFMLYTMQQRNHVSIVYYMYTSLFTNAVAKHNASVHQQMKRVQAHVATKR